MSTIYDESWEKSIKIMQLAYGEYKSENEHLDEELQKIKKRFENGEITSEELIEEYEYWKMALKLVEE